MKLSFGNFGVGMLLGVFVASGVSFAKQEIKSVEQIYDDIKIVINGSEITPRDSKGDVVEPFIIQGTTYLPVRAVAETLQMDVSWDENNKTVILQDNSGDDSEKNNLNTNESTNNGQNESEIGNTNSDLIDDEGKREEAQSDFIFADKYTTKYEELFDWTITTGAVENKTGRDFALVVVGVTYYSNDGTVLGKGSAVIQDIKNGSTKSFETLSSGKHDEAAKVVFQIDSKI